MCYNFGLILLHCCRCYGSRGTDNATADVGESKSWRAASVGLDEGLAVGESVGFDEGGHGTL
jgi:hypothetical protein